MYTPSFEYFIEIAKTLNFSVAAQKSKVSQQNLSIYMQRLENYYGVKLIERKPVMKLTEAGRATYEAAEKIEGILNGLNNEISRINHGEGKQIILGIGMPVESALMRHIPLIEYNKRYQNTSFVLEKDSNINLRDELMCGKIDMFIGLYDTSYDRQNTAEMKKLLKNCDVIELYEETENVVISDVLLKKYFPNEYPNCIDRFKRGVDIKKFASVPAVAPLPGLMRATFDKYFKENNLKMNILIETADRLVSRQFITNDLAFGFFGSTEVEELTGNLSGERVYAFPIVSPDVWRKGGVFYRRQSENLEYLNSLIDIIKEKNKKEQLST